MPDWGPARLRRRVPSKLHESLAVRLDVVARYARHHVTGEPLSRADIAALNAFERDGAPVISTRSAANALLDVFDAHLPWALSRNAVLLPMWSALLEAITLQWLDEHGGLATRS